MGTHYLIRWPSRLKLWSTRKFQQLLTRFASVLLAGASQLHSTGSSVSYAAAQEAKSPTRGAAPQEEIVDSAVNVLNTTIAHAVQPSEFVEGANGHTKGQPMDGYAR